jgi:hypothetical protein
MNGKNEIDQTDMAPDAELEISSPPIEQAQKDAAKEREWEGGYNG